MNGLTTASFRKRWARWYKTEYKRQARRLARDKVRLQNKAEISMTTGDTIRKTDSETHNFGRQTLPEGIRGEL